VSVCQGSQWVLLTDAEVKERFVVIEERKKRIIENKLRAQMREEKRQKSEELLSKLAEARMQRKLEQQGLHEFLVREILTSCFYACVRPYWQVEAFCLLPVSSSVCVHAYLHSLSVTKLVNIAL